MKHISKVVLRLCMIAMIWYRSFRTKCFGTWKLNKLAQFGPTFDQAKKIQTNRLGHISASDYQ